MAGTTDKVKGSVKEAAGKMTGDKRIEAEGKTDQAKGDVKDATRSTKESAKGVRYTPLQVPRASSAMGSVNPSGSHSPPLAASSSRVSEPDV
jgi:uncharacterized protein YjbJ (UPF0337 family)